MRLDDIVGMMDRCAGVDTQIKEGVGTDVAGAVGGFLGTAAGAVWSALAAIMQSFLSTFQRDLHHAARGIWERDRIRREKDEAAVDKDDRRAVEKAERERQASVHNEAVRTFVDQFNNQKDALTAFKKQVGEMHAGQMAELLDKLKAAHEGMPAAEAGTPPLETTTPPPAPPKVSEPEIKPVIEPAAPVKTVKDLMKELEGPAYEDVAVAAMLLNNFTGMDPEDIEKLSLDKFKRKLKDAYEDEAKMNSNLDHRVMIMDAIRHLEGV